MKQNNIPCESCGYYKDALEMPISTDHYRTIREHFVALLGGECAVCGSVFNLEIHHKEQRLAGENRGRSRRMWEWFDSYRENNITLLCHECHVKFHK